MYYGGNVSQVWLARKRSRNNSMLGTGMVKFRSLVQLSMFNGGLNTFDGIFRLVLSYHIHNQRQFQVCYCSNKKIVFGELMFNSWWRHQMESFSALPALCAGNSPVTGEFPTQRPVTRSFDVFFELRLNKRFSKQSLGWWFETPSCSLWRHCSVLTAFTPYLKSISIADPCSFETQTLSSLCLHI